MIKHNDVLTRQDAAEFLRISIRGLDRLRERGLVRGFMLGGLRMYSRRELVELVEVMESREIGKRCGGELR